MADQTDADRAQQIAQLGRPRLKTKSALSYFGSDSEVAGPLAAMLNHCRHVTIPFCGGLSILPHLTARAIVANDAHWQVINFYRFASGRFGQAAQRELLEKCQATLSHPAELRTAEFYLQTDSLPDTISQAWAFWAACWIGRKGTGGTTRQGGKPSIRRTADGGNNASRLRAAADDLAAWAAQFERCEWESVCFRELLPKVADRPDCGIYCDPPWVELGKNYLHTFAEQDHRDLAAQLDRFQSTTVVLRYGDHPLVRDLYSAWRITQATSRAQSNANKPELWITNRPTVGN